MPMPTREHTPVNNAFYDELGDRWYHDDRHAVALLRAESKLKTTYVLETLSQRGLRPGSRVLDVACGAGFVSIPLAAAGYAVHGVDLSDSSLEIARRRVPEAKNPQFDRDDAL